MCYNTGSWTKRPKEYGGIDMKSPKELALESKILQTLGEFPTLLTLARNLFADEETHEVQEHANVVSIRRLGFNDHGPVHMRQVAYNALKALMILHAAGVKTSLEKDGAGDFEDSLATVLLSGFLHDLGMSIGREEHERMSVILAVPIVDRHLAAVFPDSLRRRMVIRSTALEGILGHLGTTRIHSLEAGLILVGDGCDMTKGRARITLAIADEPHVGDIHKYSANAILHVRILPGEEKPLRIDVEMESDVGFFQVEEVLMRKLSMSPARPFIELYAGVSEKERKRYL